MINTWKIEAIECDLLDPDYANIVKTIHWRLTALDGNYSASVYGSLSVPFDRESISQYTQYQDLTQEKIIEWVKYIIGEEQILAHEKNLENQIQNQKTPASAVLPLPWEK